MSQGRTDQDGRSTVASEPGDIDGASSAPVKVAETAHGHFDQPGVAAGHSEQPDGAAAPPAAVPPIARNLVWPLIIAVLAHTFLIATWVGPSTPIRQAIGTETLRSYVLPVFEQNWRLFAPDVRRQEHGLEIRASIVHQQGEREMSEWVDLVALVARGRRSR